MHDKLYYNYAVRDFESEELSGNSVAEFAGRCGDKHT